MTIIPSAAGDEPLTENVGREILQHLLDLKQSVDVVKQTVDVLKQSVEALKAATTQTLPQKNPTPPCTDRISKPSVINNDVISQILEEEFKVPKEKVATTRDDITIHLMRAAKGYLVQKVKEAGLPDTTNWNDLPEVPLEKAIERFERRALKVLKLDLSCCEGSFIVKHALHQGYNNHVSPLKKAQRAKDELAKRAQMSPSPPPGEEVLNHSDDSTDEESDGDTPLLKNRPPKGKQVIRRGQRRVASQKPGDGVSASDDARESDNVCTSDDVSENDYASENDDASANGDASDNTSEDEVLEDSHSVSKGKGVGRENSRGRGRGLGRGRCAKLTRDDSHPTDTASEPPTASKGKNTKAGDTTRKSKRKQGDDVNNSDEPERVKGVFLLGNEDRQRSLGLIPNVPLKPIGRNPIPITVEVLPDCPVDLIIGNNWLSRARARIDYQPNKLWINKGIPSSIPITCKRYIPTQNFEHPTTDNLEYSSDPDTSDCSSEDSDFVKINKEPNSDDEDASASSYSSSSSPLDEMLTAEYWLGEELFSLSQNVPMETELDQDRIKVTLTEEISLEPDIFYTYDIPLPRRLHNTYYFENAESLGHGIDVVMSVFV
ncbi:hypothetical protein BJV82DRAFT_675584 [Fennellomyces sp. T-0311]|nr:hypothetical protein BJV82DRAFT_675584 [Fennellomyces sp. T-0311]